MQYEIKCEPFPVAEIKLAQGESVITEKGSMSWMTAGIQMETVGGSIGKALGRLVSGESIFQNKYTATRPDCMIAFANSFPGKIVALNITPDKPMVVQKSGFLASETGVELSIHFRKKLGSGLFGGEGFIMQKLSGNGTAFVEIDGDVVEYDLAPGQVMLLDTGYLAMMDASVQMDIEMVKGVKNIILGGEGFFNTKVTGPGRVWIQTMPINNLAQSLFRYMPQTKS